MTTRDRSLSEPSNDDNIVNNSSNTHDVKSKGGRYGSAQAASGKGSKSELMAIKGEMKGKFGGNSNTTNQQASNSSDLIQSAKELKEKDPSVLRVINPTVTLESLEPNPNYDASLPVPMVNDPSDPTGMSQMI